jgi:hypothetical protein
MGGRVMHPIRTHGDAIDWPDTQRILRQERAAAERKCALDLLQKLGRHPTAVELQTALVEKQGRAR